MFRKSRAGTGSDGMGHMARRAAGAGTRTPPPGGRRRAAHSMDAVISEAVALLDEAGDSALTFRALANRLGGGAASIYWYVSSKDELLDRATDYVIGAVLAEIEKQPAGDDP